MTDVSPRPWDTDRHLALIAYGLMFSSIFFAGVTGLVAVVMAYAVRGTATPPLRQHFNSLIRIFWVALVLSLLAATAGVSGAVILVSDIGAEAAGGWSVGPPVAGEIGGIPYDSRVSALFGASLLLWLTVCLWLLGASSIGFVRLATAGDEA